MCSRNERDESIKLVESNFNLTFVHNLTEFLIRNPDVDSIQPFQLDNNIPSAENVYTRWYVLGHRVVGK